MFQILQRKMKWITKSIFMLAIGMSLTVSAQMPHDAIYMPKNSVCVALSYGSSSWTEYWEGTLKRENFNMGKNTTQNVMAMIAAGITDKLNVIVGLPYIQTSNTAGNLMGMKGIQDFSAVLKYQMFVKNGFVLHGVIGGSLPASNYTADFLPMSIGLKAKTATGRLIASYTHKSGMYITTHAAYNLRGTANLDKDGYQAHGQVFNTNKVDVPDAMDAAARLGYEKGGIQAEVFVERFAALTGDNIRRNDMPFVTNKMEATSIGAYAKFQPRHLGVNARVAYVTKGLNMGQSTSYSVGLLYIFDVKKKDK
jgi:hypothetical protein